MEAGRPCYDEGGLRDDQAQDLFYELVWPRRSALLRLARILTGNDADAEDLAQEALLKAYRSIGTFQRGSRVEAWLAAILRNTRIDRLRAAGASASDVSLDGLGLDVAGDVSETVEWQQPQDILDGFSDQQVIAALQRLPEEIRWTLLLVDVEGWDQKEAAQLLDVPVGTVKSRAHRGRAMLRQALAPLRPARR